jgi:hypothetical protein
MRLPRILLAASTSCFILAAGAAIWNPAAPPAPATLTSARSSLTPDALSIRAHLPYIPPRQQAHTRTQTAPRQQAQTIPVTASPPPAPAPTEPTPAQAATGVLSPAQVGALWLQEGGPASQELTAECVVNNESGGRIVVLSPSDDEGLYQINFSNAPTAEMENPAANTAEAVHLFESEGGWLPDWVADTAACGL